MNKILKSIDPAFVQGLIKNGIAKDPAGYIETLLKNVDPANMKEINSATTRMLGMDVGNVLNLIKPRAPSGGMGQYCPVGDTTRVKTKKLFITVICIVIAAIVYMLYRKINPGSHTFHRKDLPGYADASIISHPNYRFDPLHASDPDPDPERESFADL